MSKQKFEVQQQPTMQDVNFSKFIHNSDDDYAVTGVEKYGNHGYKINGANSAGEPRYVIIDIIDGKEHGRGHNGSKLGYVENQLFLNREAILKSFGFEKPKVQQQQRAQKANKWADFKSANTADLDVTKPFAYDAQGDRRLPLDWSTAAKKDKEGLSTVSINGVPLNQLTGLFNDFREKKDVTEFFEQVVLKDFRGDKEKKREAVEYLEKNFHQLGFLNPVTRALDTGLRNENGENICKVDALSRNSMVNIRTTQNGFKVQEFVDLPTLLPCHKEVNQYANNGKIYAETGKDSLIKAEATIDLNFSKGSASPTITVESNHMEISHSGLKDHLDRRSLGQKIVDFFKDIFGLNAIENLASPSNNKSSVSSDANEEVYQNKIQLT